MTRSSSILNRLMRYCVAGGFAAIVDIGGFRSLTSADFPIVPAAVLSFTAALLANFVLSARWVFGARAHPRAFYRFALGACIGMLANVALTTCAMIELHYSPTISKFAAVAATLLLNFWINARFVFATRDGDGAQTRRAVARSDR